MTSAAVVLATVLSRHIRASQDYLASERAFAGAGSGIEEMLYQLRKNNTPEGTIENSIQYSNAVSSYKGSWKPHTDGKTACMAASGTYGNLVRRIKLGGDGCAL